MTVGSASSVPRSGPWELLLLLPRSCCHVLHVSLLPPDTSFTIRKYYPHPCQLESNVERSNSIAIHKGGFMKRNMRFR